MERFTMYVFNDKTYIDFIIYQYGKEYCDPSHSWGPNRRNHYLFHYVIEGKGTLYYHDDKEQTQTVKIGKDQGFLICPQQITTYIADHEDPWQYIWIEFDGIRAKEFLNAIGFSVNSPLYNPRELKYAYATRDEMIDIVNHGNYPNLYLMGHFYLFLNYLSQSLFNETGFSSNKLHDFYITQGINYIRNNYHRSDLSIEDVAQSIGLNRAYFSRLFKRNLGETPQSFLIHYRMIKASESLKLSQMSIQEIAHNVGYDDQMHFSRAFKRIYGISPREWRNKNQIIIGSK